MKNIIYGILIVMLANLLAGCATNPPKEESQENPYKWQQEMEVIQPRR
jgi:starvation-inducible outer membrane lipoprotein